jgi:hypothetical protein
VERRKGRHRAKATRPGQWHGPPVQPCAWCADPVHGDAVTVTFPRTRCRSPSISRVWTSIAPSCGRGRHRRYGRCSPAPRPGLAALRSPVIHALEGHYRRSVSLSVFSDACHPGILGGKGFDARHRSGRDAGAHRRASPSFTLLPAVPTPAAPTCATGPSAVQSRLDSGLAVPAPESARHRWLWRVVGHGPFRVCGRP